jgi:orotidine-5'-phosphate decarboxylase
VKSVWPGGLAEAKKVTGQSAGTEGRSLAIDADTAGGSVLAAAGRGVFEARSQAAAARRTSAIAAARTRRPRFCLHGVLSA